MKVTPLLAVAFLVFKYMMVPVQNQLNERQMGL